MYSLKLAHLIKEKTGAEVYNFYIDMRAPGQGLRGVLQPGRRGRGPLHPGQGGRGHRLSRRPREEWQLVIRAEDTLLGLVRRIPVDMVVLATGLEPQADAEEVRRMFNITCGGDGFFWSGTPSWRR